MVTDHLLGLLEISGTSLEANWSTERHRVRWNGDGGYVRVQPLSGYIRDQGAR